jgi:hypothetical protein
VGNWYKVTKRINDRLYDYWQRTERDGNYVKTYNKYIGPSTASQETITGQQWSTEQNALRAVKQAFPHLDCRDCRMGKRDGAWRCLRHYNEAEDNERAIRQTGVGITTDQELFKPEVLTPDERREDERIRYGSRAARIREQESAVKKAKRKSSGTGAENPFIGKILRKKPRDKI